MTKKLWFLLFPLVLFSVRGSADIYDYQRVPHHSIIRTASYQYHVPQALIRALIKVESGFKVNAVSRVGAQGLMQLMPKTAKKLGVENSFDPRQNILAGTRYFRKLLNQFGGNIELALAAYNAGPEAVKKFNKIPPYKETQKFVKKVLKYYKKYSDLNG